MTSVLIGFIICFSAELLLSVALIYREVKPRERDEMNENLRQDYPWERVLTVVFDAFHAGFSIAGIIAIVFVRRSRRTIYWLDMAVRSNLQLFTGTNVRISRQTLQAS
jgi:hypothetical protein